MKWFVKINDKRNECFGLKGKVLLETQVFFTAAIRVCTVKRQKDNSRLFQGGLCACVRELEFFLNKLLRVIN